MSRLDCNETVVILTPPKNDGRPGVKFTTSRCRNWSQHPQVPLAWRTGGMFVPFLESGIHRFDHNPITKALFASSWIVLKSWAFCSAFLKRALGANMPSGFVPSTFQRNIFGALGTVPPHNLRSTSHVLDQDVAFISMKSFLGRLGWERP